MSWMKKLRAACLPESEPLVLFSGCVLRPFPSSSSPPVVIFQRLLPPSKKFSPVVLVIWCKYPKCVSFYILYFCRHWEVVRSMQQQRSRRTARKRDVAPNNFIPLCLSRFFPSRVFHFKLYNVEKIIIINYCHTLLTASWRRWWFVKD